MTMMTKRMTDTEIDECMSRAEVATRPPWKPLVLFRDGCWPVGPYTRDEKQAKRDAEFMAHARSDVPRLGLEVLRHRQELLALRGIVAEISNLVSDVDDAEGIAARIHTLAKRALDTTINRRDMTPDARLVAHYREQLARENEVIAADEQALDGLARDPNVQRYIEIERRLRGANARQDDAARSLGMQVARMTFTTPTPEEMRTPSTRPATREESESAWGTAAPGDLVVLDARRESDEPV